jgi:hypothetical protein
MLVYVCIAMTAKQELLQLLHGFLLKIGITGHAMLESAVWIMDVQLSIGRVLPSWFNQRPNTVTQLAMDAEYVWSRTATIHRFVYLNPKRCECKSRIVLTDVVMELTAVWIMTVQQFAQLSWWCRESRQLNLAVITAHVVTPASAMSDLFSCPM